MPYQIKMLDDNLLLQKVEQKEGEFISTDDLDKRGPVYEICHSATHPVGAKILLKPGHYETILVDFEVFTFATNDDILGWVEEVEGDSK